MTCPNRFHWLLLMLLAACLGLYYPGLAGPMLLDDFPQLERLMNSSGHGLAYLLQEFIFSTSGPLGRPVAMFSFILDSHFWGAQLWHWKLTNVVLHLATVLALYWLVHALLRNTGYSTAQRHWIALFVSAAWVLHPLHASTVLYTVQRMTLLSALFALLSMATYLEGRRGLQMHAPRARLWLVFSLTVFFPLAAFSKENGLLVPLYLVLIELIVFTNSRMHHAWQNLSAPKKWLLGIFLTFALLAGLGFAFVHIIGNGYAVKPFTLSERLLTEPRVMAMYIGQIIAPSWSSLGFYHDDIQVSTSLLSPLSTLLSLTLVFGLIAFGVRLRKHNPVASFGILIFFASHLMESTVIPLELMFEHRNYFGSFGILLALTALIVPHIVSRRIFAIAGGAIIAALGLLLLQFSYIWGDKERLDTQLYVAHPDSPSAISVMADRYVDAWSPHLAWELLDRPERAGYKLQALVIRCRLTHRLDDSDLTELNSRIDSLVQSYELTGLIELSNQWLDDQCAYSGELFLQTLALALDHTRDNLAKQKLLIYKAYFLRKSGSLETAIATLESAFRISQNSAMPLFIATEWLLDAGDKARAKQYYQRALAAAGESQAITDEYRAHFKNRIAPGSK